MLEKNTKTNKPFDIHEWQAKQRRLTEERSQESMNNADIRALQTVVGEYSLNKVLNTISVIADRIGKHDEAYMIKNLASKIQDFDQEDPRMDPAIRSDFDDPVMNEHHAGDYKPGFLKQSVNKFLDKLKKANETDYNKVEKIMEKHFSAKKANEASMTGTGASFQAGSGEGYATPRAFGDNKRKKKKGYMGYKEI